MEASLLPDKTGVERHYGRPKRKVYVLRGMGGIGKTQLAREYADRHRDRYSAVAWVDGSSEQTVKQTLARWATELPADQISKASRQYATGKGGDIDEVVQEVLGWLAQPGNTGWLMVVDNVDREHSATSIDKQAYDVKRYFPRAEHGAIIITTRLAQLERLGPSWRVKKVDKKTSLAILQSWCDVRDGERCLPAPIPYKVQDDLTDISSRYQRAQRAARSPRWPATRHRPCRRLPRSDWHRRIEVPYLLPTAVG